MKFFTRTDLDLQLVVGCGNPDCKSHHEHAPLDRLALTAKCHPKAGLSVWYYREGFIGVYCAKCGRQVVPIAVAP